VLPRLREHGIMPSTPTRRIAYIDWMRGLACVLMFQTHCYDAWLGGNARKGDFFMWSQIGGTLPAPLFLFLAGISVALMTNKLRQKNPQTNIAVTIFRRGAEILALGFLFRLQEFLIAWGWAPWTDLLRVDVLNIIGVSLMLLGGMCGIVLPITNRYASSPAHVRMAVGGTAAGTALAIALLTPLLWTTWRLHWLPWPLESYIDGVNNLGQPQATLFPIFPWAGFAFAGLATGLFILSDWARQRETAIFLSAGMVGVSLIYLTRWLDSRPEQLYRVYDYWHTSPNFFVLRVGLLLIALTVGYVWCRWGAGQWGFSPLIQLGQTSLLVYWVHLELVYGRFSILPKRVLNIRTASVGLLTIFLMMVLLSWLRTRFKGHGSGSLAWFRRTAKAI
jgi:uncharacterized membrane protein